MTKEKKEAEIQQPISVSIFKLTLENENEKISCNINWLVVKGKSKRKATGEKSTVFDVYCKCCCIKRANFSN